MEITIWAAFTALSTSSLPASATLQIIFPFEGFITGKDFPSKESTKQLPMNKPVFNSRVKFWTDTCALF